MTPTNWQILSILALAASGFCSYQAVLTKDCQGQEKLNSAMSSALADELRENGRRLEFAWRWANREKLPSDTDDANWLNVAPFGQVPVLRKFDGHLEPVSFIWDQNSGEYNKLLNKELGTRVRTLYSDLALIAKTYRELPGIDKTNSSDQELRSKVWSTLQAKVDLVLGRGLQDVADELSK